MYGFDILVVIIMLI